MANDIVFSFTRVDKFLKLLIDDSSISTSMFDGVTPNFKIVLCQSCPNNITDCLDTDGTLLESEVDIINEDDGDCALLWSDGVNNDVAISISTNAVVMDLDDRTYLMKGAFLIVKSTGKVLAYSINNAPISVSDEVVFPVDGVVWSVVTQLYAE